MSDPQVGQTSGAYCISVHELSKMMAPQIVRLKDYELVCGAAATDGGKFEPTLVISSNTWPSRPRSIAVRAGAFATEAIAMESAQTQGVEWIANFGKRLSAPQANPR